MSWSTAWSSYPEFLPWCGGAQVVTARPGGKTVRIDIDYHGVKAHFTTDNVNRAPESIVITLKDGPFRHLHGEWRFHALAPAACKVEFELAYEFSSASPRGGGRSGLQPHCEYVHRRIRPPRPGGVSQTGMTPLRFSVTVAYAAPDVEALVVDDAFRRRARSTTPLRSRASSRHLALDPAQLEPAVFGQRVNGHTPLAPGDRIELTRALIADPKRARRKRAGDHPRPKSDPRHKLRK